MSEPVIFKDFSKKRADVAFALQGRTFNCVRAIALDAMQEIVLTMKGKAEDEDKDGNVALPVVIDRLKAAFKLVLRDDEYVPFLAMLGDKDDPADLDQLQEIISWLVGVYTTRPTPPSSDSSPTSPSDGSGTSSTAGAAFAESLPLS